jgi:hypothetical protein
VHFVLGSPLLSPSSASLPIPLAPLPPSPSALPPSHSAPPSIAVHIALSMRVQNLTVPASSRPASLMHTQREDTRRCSGIEKGGGHGEPPFSVQNPFRAQEDTPSAQKRHRKGGGGEGRRDHLLHEEANTGEALRLRVAARGRAPVKGSGHRHLVTQKRPVFRFQV